MRTVHTLVLSSTGQGNALGRALSMALVAQELGNVDVLALGGPPWWPGHTQFPHEVTSLGSRRDFQRHLQALAWCDPVLLWVSKAFSPLPEYIAEARSTLGDRLVVLTDFDDDDAALAEEFVRYSLTNRLKLNPLRSGSARRLRSSQGRAIEESDALTFATQALATVLPKGDKPSYVIPHVRASPKQVPRGPRPHVLRLGMLGTIRGHKGLDRLLALRNADPGVELVTFAQPATDALGAVPNLLRLPADTPLEEAYASVDIALIPIDPRSHAADVQFPAKLVDAFAARVPVAATPTRAMLEVAGQAALYVHDWTDVDAVSRSLRAAPLLQLADDGFRVWRGRLTPEAGARELSRVVDQCLRERSGR